jgi:Kinetochore Sim4 complex subunit FTA2
METQGKRENARGELMSDNIVGIFLSNELLQNPNTMSWDPRPKLRRFVHHGEIIQCSRLLGIGEHGVVLLTVIKGVEYALKVVSTAALH